MADIVVVGSINTDMVVQASRIPAPGETVLGGAFRQVAGGKGANQAVAAARAGSRVAMVGCVGDDRLGLDAVERLSAAGVDVTHVHRVAETPTGVALIMVDAAGQNCIAVAPGANGRLTPAHLGPAESRLAAAAVVLLQLEIPLETVVRTAALAVRHGVRVILDPAPAPLDPLPAELWERLDVVTPNAIEAQALTGVTVRNPADAWAAGERLLGRGVGAAVITRGRDGVSLITREGRTAIGGHAVAARDTTAAGDVFAGALAARLAEGASLGEAVRFGNGAAAVSVTRPGAQSSAPTRNEIAIQLAASQ